MEETNKTVSINLDSKSIETLKKVDAIHRDSVINIGLALVEKTGYFKTLAGISDADTELDDVASLDIESDDDTPKKPKAKKGGKASKEEAPATAKPKQSWDSF